MNPNFSMPARELASLVEDARRRTRLLVDTLDDAQWQVPRLDVVNPPLWEVGHVGNFYETFILRLLDPGRAPLIENGNALFNSFVIDHDDRWSAPLPDREGAWAYVDRVVDAALARLGNAAADPWETYLYLLAVYHEDMHDEAFTYTRQTLGYPAPPLGGDAPSGTMTSGLAGAGPLEGDVEIPGGEFLLGAAGDQPFAFDNEKWGHPVTVAPFRMARAPVTQAEFARFVDQGGYGEQRCWDYEGWRWRTRAKAEHPVYWRKEGDTWQRRHYDAWAPLEPHRPVVHVNGYEAEAWCRWAGRRLPSEAEWELAATAVPTTRVPTTRVPTTRAPTTRVPAANGQGLRQGKRRYPWGEAPPDASLANLDGFRLGCADVAAYPAGDSAHGCRQMIGNVWEWTASAFYPFPGYLLDHPYKEYSAPWFGDRKVLKGGAWATRGRMIHNMYRNFFTPDRRDVFAGFRTCAL